MILNNLIGIPWFNLHCFSIGKKSKLNRIYKMSTRKWQHYYRKDLLTTSINMLRGMLNRRTTAILSKICSLAEFLFIIQLYELYFKIKSPKIYQIVFNIHIEHIYWMPIFTHGVFTESRSFSLSQFDFVGIEMSRVVTITGHKFSENMQH